MIAGKFLGTKVARRILLLFVVCALLPITVLAVLSLTHVNGELSRQARARIRQTSKAVGLSAFERLLLVDAQMQLLAGTVSTTGGESLSAENANGLNRRFIGLFLTLPDGSGRPVFGNTAPPPRLTAQQMEHMASGKSVLVAQPADAKHVRVLMARRVGGGNGAILWGQIAPAYLWEEGNLPPDTDLCVIQEDGLELFCPDWVPEGFGVRTARLARREPLRRFEWEGGGKEYLAAGWPLFLRAQFNAPGWLLVLSEPKAQLLAPIASFKRSFLLVVLLSLWIVLLLSNVQIRRNMDPLERLNAATQRFSLQEFDTPVSVKSGDEFQDLAESFNGMASRLRRQFHALNSSNHIDRAILSALDRERIIETVLDRAPELVPADAVMVGVVSGTPPDSVRTHLRARGNLSQLFTGNGAITPDHARQLSFASHGLSVDVHSEFPDYLRHLTLIVPEVSHWILFPLQIGSRLAGLLAFGQSGDTVFSDDDRVQAHHLADQLAVAFANAGLIEELETLHLGALTALARVIDAKSSWTAGHSERVAGLSLKLAERLGLPPQELEIIHRGAMLHDIGKIGVSADILDKPGRLTAEEIEAMRQHVTIGARILEPIARCADILPIVLHHHERMDGQGYPHGLSGEGIPILARIVCVADCFDALASERPYRASLPTSVCCDVIERGRGTEFDPLVVDALFTMIKESETGAVPHEELSHV